MLKNWFLTTFLLLGFASIAQAEDGAIHSALDVMTFADSYQCGGERQPPQSYCDAVDFKAWTAEEKAIVSEYLANINDPRLVNFLKTIKEKGITKLYRVNHFAKYFNNPTLRRVEYFRSGESPLLQVDPMNRVLTFSNTFFTGTSFIDPWAKVERRQLNILHELVHVYDMAVSEHLSDDPGFKNAVQWIWNGKEWGPAVPGIAQVQKDFESVLALVRKGQVAEGYLLDRELGRQYGIPTVYGMLNSHELFAEIFSYYIFDPTAETYLPSEVVAHVKSMLGDSK
jgi:hypothetical protein